MLVAGVGSTLALELDLIPRTFAAFEARALEFGELEPLVDRMSSTFLDRLQPFLVERMRDGVRPKQLIAAGALANARAFGGQDYQGYHVMMALVPAFEICEQVTDTSRALPILKVLYRNTARIQGAGRQDSHALGEIDAATIPVAEAPKRLHELTRGGHLDRAESVLARLVDDNLGGAFSALQPLVQDDYEVHRVVLAWRAWDILRLTGREHAETLLRQTVRFCVDGERPDRTRELRQLLPRLLDEHGLLSKTLGDKTGDAQWFDELVLTIFSGTRADAAAAAAAALAEGYSAETIGEALSVAATLLLLHDPGRPSAGSFQRQKGSVHGASVGVHASDAVNAWRSIARVSNPRNTVASLIVGAYHTAGQGRRVGREYFPFLSRVEEADREMDPEVLLDALDDAIRGSDQARASAIVHTYGTRGLPSDPVFERLRSYAVSEDGALHAEKYFRTVQSEFTGTRPSFRWKHLVALARVTASEFGAPAPGREQARELLALADAK